MVIDGVNPINPRENEGLPGCKTPFSPEESTRKERKEDETIPNQTNTTSNEELDRSDGPADKYETDPLVGLGIPARVLRAIHETYEPVSVAVMLSAFERAIWNGTLPDGDRVDILRGWVVHRIQCETLPKLSKLYPPGKTAGGEAQPCSNCDWDRDAPKGYLWVTSDKFPNGAVRPCPVCNGG